MRTSVLCLLFFAVFACPALAQSPAPAEPSDPPAQPVEKSSFLERELNIIALPTTHSLKRHGTSFRLTHRFTRDLRFGTIGSLVEDLFGLDAGAIIGLELRFAPTDNLHVAVHRTNLFKDVQFSARLDALREHSHGVGLSFVSAVEGDNNFQDHHQPSAGVVLSRSVGKGRAALYVSPTLAWNTPTVASGHEGHDHDHDFETPAVPEAVPEDYTAFVGLGARLHLRPTVFAAAEYAPRAGGHRPDRGAWGVAVEKHTRGHMFQINVTNSFATTFGQIARGGNRHNVYLGFNLARTF